jgi:hypothetical protein
LTLFQRCRGVSSAISGWFRSGDFGRFLSW